MTRFRPTARALATERQLRPDRVQGVGRPGRREGSGKAGGKPQPSSSPRAARLLAGRLPGRRTPSTASRTPAGPSCRSSASRTTAVFETDKPLAAGDGGTTLTLYARVQVAVPAARHRQVPPVGDDHPPRPASTCVPARVQAALRSRRTSGRTRRRRRSPPTTDDRAACSPGCGRSRVDRRSRRPSCSRPCRRAW